MNNNENGNILELRSLNKQFAKVHAVKDVSFEVKQGDIFAFLGPNGAGKTTTLRILLGIFNADSGSIHWHINGSNHSPLPEHIGYLPEERGLYPDIPILKSLIYLGSIRGMAPKNAKSEALSWLERLGLTDRGNDKLQTLSKGNQQKIQFIASILHKPKFAILDEPFSGFDPVNQELFIEIIKEVREMGTTILLSAHQMQLVEKIANRLFLINQGEQLYYGTLEDVYRIHSKYMVFDIESDTNLGESYLKLFSFIEPDGNMKPNHYKVMLRPGTNLNEGLAEIARIEGLKNITMQKPNLHDIFLQLVNHHKS